MYKKANEDTYSKQLRNALYCLVYKNMLPTLFL